MTEKGEIRRSVGKLCKLILPLTHTHIYIYLYIYFRLDSCLLHGGDGRAKTLKTEDGEIALQSCEEDGETVHGFLW